MNLSIFPIFGFQAFCSASDYDCLFLPSRKLVLLIFHSLSCSHHTSRFGNDVALYFIIIIINVCIHSTIFPLPISTTLWKLGVEFILSVYSSHVDVRVVGSSKHGVKIRSRGFLEKPVKNVLCFSGFTFHERTVTNVYIQAFEITV